MPQRSAPRLRVLLVGDQPRALGQLRALVAQVSEVEVAGVVGASRQAPDMLKATLANAVLLDVRIPPPRGLELLARLDHETAPAIIVVSAYNRFAADAFALDAADYLLTPVTLGRLREAFDRARRKLEARSAARRIAELEAVLASLTATAGPAARQDGFLREIWIKDRGERVRLRLETVDWIQAEGDHIRLHGGGRSFLLRLSIRRLERKLDPQQFLRVHRSALVRFERVVRVARPMGGQAVAMLQSGAEVPVSRRYASRLKRLARSG